MAAFQNNLLVRLHKWATRQDENFLTETLAFLLEFLRDNEPEAASELISRLSGGVIVLTPQQIRGLEIRTQIIADDGIPDIELRTTEHFVIIEVKSESDATENQLARYRRILVTSGIPYTSLILLTRYPATTAGADRYFRWYQVAEWIDQESNKYKFNAKSEFLVEQFLGLLKARNMTMSQVTWELPTGVRSMRALADMLYEAASACKLKATIRGNTEWIGIHLDGRQYCAGIEFSAPERLYFGTDYASVDPNAAEKLGLGATAPWQDGDGHEWWRDVDLESEDVHFFARSKASQMQFLEQFLRENYEHAKKVTLPGTPNPTPTSEIDE
jgi:hypothetical protein